MRSRISIAFLLICACTGGPLSSKGSAPYVRLALAYLSECLPLRHHALCGLHLSSQHTAVCVDAHALSTGVGLGGWLPFIDSEGTITVALVQRRHQSHDRSSGNLNAKVNLSEPSRCWRLWRSSWLLGVSFLLPPVNPLPGPYL